MKKKVWGKPVCERVKLVPAEACKSECKKPSHHLTCLLHREHASGLSS